MENEMRLLKKCAHRGCIGLRLCDDGSGFGRAQYGCGSGQQGDGYPSSDLAARVRRSARNRAGPSGACVLLAAFLRILCSPSEEAGNGRVEPESQRLREVRLHRQRRRLRRIRSSSRAEPSNAGRKARAQTHGLLRCVQSTGTCSYRASPPVQERLERAVSALLPRSSAPTRGESRNMSRFAVGSLSRRRFLQAASLFGVLPLSTAAWSDAFVELGLPGGPDQRSVTTAFPQKGAMILQRSRPPLLETPFDVFDRGVFTPNDQFFVRWHWALIPTEVDVAAFKLTLRGQVNQALSLSMADILAMPRVEMAAVNQCSGNSRGLLQPRVPGAQWENSAMGNALWTGVRLRDVLDRAGVKHGAVAARFRGLDEALVEGARHS